jgi:hypothetical protein
VDVIRVMLATAPHEASVAQQEQAATAIYRAALVPIAERLVQLGGLQPGINAADAVDLLSRPPATRRRATAPACPICAEIAAPSACTASASRASPGSAWRPSTISFGAPRPSGDTAQ